MKIIRAKDYKDMSRKAANIISAMPALGELEKAWRNIDLEHSWHNRRNGE